MKFRPRHMLACATVAAAAVAAPLAFAQTGPPVNVVPPSINHVGGEHSYRLAADPGVWENANLLYAQWAKCDTNGRACVWEMPSRINKVFNAGRCDECTVHLLVTGVNDDGATTADGGFYSFPPLH